MNQTKVYTMPINYWCEVDKFDTPSQLKWPDFVNIMKSTLGVDVRTLDPAIELDAEEDETLYTNNYYEIKMNNCQVFKEMCLTGNAIIASFIYRGKADMSDGRVLEFTVYKPSFKWYQKPCQEVEFILRLATEQALASAGAREFGLHDDDRYVCWNVSSYSDEAFETPEKSLALVNELVVDLLHDVRDLFGWMSDAIKDKRILDGIRPPTAFTSPEERDEYVNTQVKKAMNKMNLVGEKEKGLEDV